MNTDKQDVAKSFFEHLGCGNGTCSGEVVAAAVWRPAKDAPEVIKQACQEHIGMLIPDIGKFRILFADPTDTGGCPKIMGVDCFKAQSSNVAFIGFHPREVIGVNDGERVTTPVTPDAEPDRDPTLVAGDMVTGFKNGTIYFYRGVRYSTYLNILNAPSVGSAFSKFVRGKEGVPVDMLTIKLFDKPPAPPADKETASVE